MSDNKQNAGGTTKPDDQTATKFGQLINIPNYYPGLIVDYCAGDIHCWQDYIRSEIDNCNAYWREQIELILKQGDNQE